jgi:hypothetical protein
MAAADLALGRAVSVKPIPEEIIWFLLAKEFSWSPKVIKQNDAKDIRAITHILAVYNKVKNQMVERQNKKNK